MRIQIIISLVFIWLVVGIIGNILEGEFVKQQDVEMINEMTSYQILSSQGFMGIPVMGIAFFRELPAFIAFDYDWLTSGFAIIRLLMMAVSLGIIWGLAQTFLPGMFGALGNLLRWNR